MIGIAVCRVVVVVDRGLGGLGMFAARWLISSCDDMVAVVMAHNLSVKSVNNNC